MTSEVSGFARVTRTRAEKKLTLGALALFAGVWLLAGFALGTLTLLGPVRAIVTLFRKHNLGSAIETTAVIVAIGVLVIITTVGAVTLSRLILETRRKLIRYGIPLLLLAAAIATDLMWMRPELLQVNSGADESVARFTFGPYPDRKKLESLRNMGYTGVITLLHPAVVPFEPQLLAAEKKNAREVGMQIVHIPMLPWLSSNKASIEQLETIVKSGSGRYYVHCYLGADRVLVARRVIERHVPANTTHSQKSFRSLSQVRKLERGAIVEVDQTTYVGPYPTSEEFVGFVLAAQVDHVISLLDPANPEDARRIAEERRVLEEFRVPFTVIPLSEQKYEPAAVVEAARKVQGIKARKLVHAFFGPDDKRSSIASAFVDAYKTGLPPVLRRVERAEFTSLEPKILQPNVVAGDVPAGGDLRTLQRHGVRHVICTASAERCRPLALAAADLQMKYSAMDVETAEKITESRGGPYYVADPDGDFGSSNPLRSLLR